MKQPSAEPLFLQKNSQLGETDFPIKTLIDALATVIPLLLFPYSLFDDILICSLLFEF